MKENEKMGALIMPLRIIVSPELQWGKSIGKFVDSAATALRKAKVEVSSQKVAWHVAWQKRHVRCAHECISIDNTHERRPAHAVTLTVFVFRHL